MPSLKSIPTTLALLALVFASPPAPAQDATKTAQIKLQIAQITKNLDDLGTVFGKSVNADTMIRQIGRGESLTFTLDLKKGDQRNIVAFCNPECAPMETRITDPAGGAACADKDHPSVCTVVAAVDGPHKAVVTPTGCKAARCDIGVIVRAKVRPAP